MNSPSKETGSPTGAYQRQEVDRTWLFAQPVPGNDPDIWRKDAYGAWIHRFGYGDSTSPYGWKIDDFGSGLSARGVTPLRPIQWQNYLDRFNAPTRSRITADGLDNTRELL